jgi:hypothetical protein
LEFRPQFAPNDANYSRDRPLMKWGLGNSLHGSNPEPPMSALGQKRTSECAQSMSALPAKADIGTGRNIFDVAADASACPGGRGQQSKRIAMDHGGEKRRGGIGQE